MKRQAMQIMMSGDLNVLDISSDQLRILQTAVGGYVQAIDLDDDTTLWVHEEGKMIGLEHNPAAQILWDRAFGEGTDHIVGNAVITGTPDSNGNTRGLSKEQMDMLWERFTQIVI